MPISPIPANVVATVLAVVAALFAIVAVVLAFRLRQFRRAGLGRPKAAALRPEPQRPAAVDPERLKAAVDEEVAKLAGERLRQTAGDFQRRLLPPAPLSLQGCSVSGRTVPADLVATDFYDFVPIGRERIVLTIGDVRAKGADAALVMATLKRVLPLIGQEPPYAAPLLGELNEQMSAYVADSQSISMALAVYTPGEHTLSVANAGLPNPLFIRADGAARTIDLAGPRDPVGMRKQTSYESVAVKLEPGDRVLFFTDGLADARLPGEAARTRDLQAVFDAIDAPHGGDRTAVLLECTG